MKKWLLLIALSLLPVFSFAQGNVGLGLILFGPTGLSGIFKVSDENSVDVALAWRTHPGTETYLHSTYVWRFPDYYRFEGKSMLFYSGVGGRLLTETKESNCLSNCGRTFVGIRTIAGTAYTLPNAPVEFFGEVGLTMDLSPSTILSFNLAAGGRYYF